MMPGPYDRIREALVEACGWINPDNAAASHDEYLDRGEKLTAALDLLAELEKAPSAELRREIESRVAANADYMLANQHRYDELGDERAAHKVLKDVLDWKPPSPYPLDEDHEYALDAARVPGDDVAKSVAARETLAALLGYLGPLALGCSWGTNEDGPQVYKLDPMTEELAATHLERLLVIAQRHFMADETKEQFICPAETMEARNTEPIDLVFCEHCGVIHGPCVTPRGKLYGKHCQVRRRAILAEAKRRAS